MNWICQECRTPIEPGAGFIELVNNDPEASELGSYPVHATPDLAHSVSGEGYASLSDLLPALLEHRLAVDLLVVHYACDPHPETEGYSVEVDRAETLDAWVGWVLHLAPKQWLSKSDLRRVLAFWWTHRGESPPHA